MFKTALPDL